MPEPEPVLPQAWARAALIRFGVRPVAAPSIVARLAATLGPNSISPRKTKMSLTFTDRECVLPSRTEVTIWMGKRL